MSLKAYLGLAAASVAAALATAAPAADKDFKPSSQAIRAHMGFLASDLLEGREAGTRGFDIAAAYVAERFGELGLKPMGGDGSYLQPVPLIAFRPTVQGAIQIKGPGGRRTPLKFGDDYLPLAGPAAGPVKLNAPLVFAGFGIVAPEHGRDDYKDLDVTGKIVVVLSDAPKSFQSEERAYYGGRRLKMVNAAAHGAAGLILVHTPTLEKIHPFERGRPRWQSWSMTWRDPAGKPFYPGAPTTPLAYLSLKGAQKLFAGAPHGYDEVMAAADQPAGDPPRFAFGASASAALASETRVLQSANVAGMIEGSDPALKDQVVVLSAHLDHLGISAAVKGDAVYNGALDNAAGIATLLEVARGFSESDKAPKRSMLFLAVTAEEKGLIGAEYFAHNPTAPKASLAADVNLDMPILLYDFSDVVAFGADRSSIGPTVRKAAAPMGLGLADDPWPDEGIFVRSDHFRFVEQGVPSVFLVTGPGNGGAAASQRFLSTNYHQPSDDLSLPIDYAAAAKFAGLNYAVARALADAKERPSWNAGDFFGTRFGGGTLTQAGAQ